MYLFNEVGIKEMKRNNAKERFQSLIEGPQVSDAVSLIQIAETLNEMCINKGTLRDHFAGQAMVAYIAEGKSIRDIPHLAYDMADSMIEARKK